MVLVPGLLSAIANATASNASLPGNLARLLGFAEQLEFPEAVLPSVESLVAGALLSNETESGAAYLTWLADYSVAGSHNDQTHKHNQPAATVMRTDPAYQQIDMNNATLGNPLELELSVAECTALQETLNHHFKEDGIRFQSKDPHRWYCHFDSSLQVTTTPTSASIGRDVASVRPTGDDARRWRSKLAEIEMLLFEHPVNTARQENNKLPVNTLWLWGEGIPASSAGVKNTSIYSDNFYTRSVASYLGLQCNDLPDTAAAMQVVEESTLIVIDKFTQPNSLQPNSHEYLQWFDEIISDQLWMRLQSTNWPKVTLWLGDNRLYHVQASVKKQFFRRLFQKPKPLSAYLPEAESSMNAMPMDASSHAVQQPKSQRV